MTQNDLLKMYNETDYSDYTKKYLLPFWAEKAKNFKDTYPELLSENFVNNHTIQDSISEEKAKDIFIKRGKSVSTLLTTNLVINVLSSIVNYGVIEHLAMVSKEFTNYRLNCTGFMITVYRDDNNIVISQFRDSCIIGLNKNGLVTHFHGDTSYGSLLNVYSTGSNINQIRKIK